jgi:hypothetical protein
MFNLRKLLSNKEFILGAVIVIIAIVLFSYDGSKRSYMDGLTDGGVAPYVPPESNNAQFAHAQEFSDSPSMDALAPKQQNSSSQSLLPADSNNAWAALNPSMNLGAMPDLLQAGQHIGMSSTILRNANLQLRSDPAISKQDVGPWMQTTIEADPGRVPMEIGSAGTW